MAKIANIFQGVLRVAQNPVRPPDTEFFRSINPSPVKSLCPSQSLIITEVPFREMAIVLDLEPKYFEQRNCVR